MDWSWISGLARQKIQLVTISSYKMCTSKYTSGFSTFTDTYTADSFIYVSLHFTTGSDNTEGDQWFVSGCYHCGTGQPCCWNCCDHDNKAPRLCLTCCQDCCLKSTQRDKESVQRYVLATLTQFAAIRSLITWFQLEKKTPS